MVEQSIDKRGQMVEMANLIIAEAVKRIAAFDEQHPKHPGLDPEYENLSYYQVNAEMIRDDIASGKETDEDIEGGDWELLGEYLQYLGLVRA